MKKLNTLFAIATLLLLGACEKTIKIDVPVKPSRLVVNGRLVNNDLLRLGVGKSRGILEPDTQASQEELFTVKTAVPVVFENGVPVDTLVYQPAQYEYKTMKNKRVRPGYVYTVVVKAPGYTDAEAQSLMPSQSVIAGLQLVKEARINSYGEKMDEITLKLNDPAGEKNYYLVQIWGGWNGSAGMHPLYCVSTSDKDVEQIAETDPTGTETCVDGEMVLIQDKNFNGASKLLKLYANTNELRSITDPTTNKLIRPYVKVFRITEDEFRYLRSLQAYESTDGNPFAEPINIYTNVKNGYGIFSLSTVAADTLR